MFKRIYNTKNFYISSSVYAAFSIAGAIVSYLIYPFLIRILPRATFGDFAATLAIASQLSSIFLAFNIVSLYVSKRYGDSRELLEYLQQRIVKIFLVFALLILALSPALKGVLRFGGYSSIIALLLLMLLSVPAVIWMGFLQGKQEMIRIGIYAFTAACFKIVFALLLALLFKNISALFGIVLGQFLAVILLAKLPGHKTPSLKSLFMKISTPGRAKNLNVYLASAVVVSLFMSFAQNADILYGKSLLPFDLAGTFVGISSLSNVAFYICFLLVWIALSGIDLNNPKVSLNVLKRAGGLIIMIGSLLFGILMIFEKNILQILIGETSHEFYRQLPYDTLYQSVIALVTLYIYWCLVHKKSGVVIMTIAFVLPLLIVPFLFDTRTPMGLVWLLLKAELAGISLMGLIILIRYFVKSPYYVQAKKIN